MSGDDELRRRLQEIPGPGARLDSDAIVAGAKRRRRPKTIALTSAATVASVLIVAPFVVPGLSPLRPASEQGMSSDAGAQPESATEYQGDGEAQPPAASSVPDEAAEGDTGASGGVDTGASGGGDTGAAGAPGPDDARSLLLSPEAPQCGLTDAGDAGLALRFLEQPAMQGPGSGFATVELTNVGDAAVSLAAEPVAFVEIASSASGTEGWITGGEPEALSLAPGASAVLEATSAVLPAGVCGDGTASDDLPLVIVAIDGGERVGLVGAAWGTDVR